MALNLAISCAVSITVAVGQPVWATSQTVWSQIQTAPEPTPSTSGGSSSWDPPASLATSPLISRCFEDPCRPQACNDALFPFHYRGKATHQCTGQGGLPSFLG